MFSNIEAKRLKALGQNPDFPICLRVGKEAINKNHADVLSKALTAKELAKIRFVGDLDREEIRGMAEQLQKETASELIEIRGKSALYYKENPKAKKHVL